MTVVCICILILPCSVDVFIDAVWNCWNWTVMFFRSKLNGISIWLSRLPSVAITLLNRLYVSQEWRASFLPIHGNLTSFYRLKLQPTVSRQHYSHGLPVVRLLRRFLNAFQKKPKPWFQECKSYLFKQRCTSGWTKRSFHGPKKGFDCKNILVGKCFNVLWIKSLYIWEIAQNHKWTFF